jgi:dolichol-phosphate mannosyltransferase
MSETPVLSVVVPTRDEAENVVPLVSRLRSALEGLDAEVLFVDDSDDETTATLEAIAARDPRVRMLHREGAERSGGLSTAVVGGLHHARGEYVCVMDADLQHPPELIPAMLAAAHDGADVVVASRYTRGGSSRGLDGLGRRLVSRAAGALAGALFTEARQSTDPLSGFFLCRRRVLDGIEFRPVGFKILLELLVCIPGLEVRDVPLRFAGRVAGSSKASARQGLLFLGHMRSLVLEVEGSARPWKFGLVGVSGLAILLPLIAVLTGRGGVAPLAAFLPAFLPSLLWNTILNRRWTFADQGRGRGDGTAQYLRRAAVSGAVMFAAYAGLGLAGLPPVLAALASAALAMILNGLANRAAVHRPPRLWGDIATADDVREALDRISAELRADRTYVLPPRGAAPAALPDGMLDRVVRSRRAVLFAEAASHRTQRRSNIAMSSTLLVPVFGSGSVHAVLVCERLSSRPFTNGDLDAAMAAALGLASLIGPTAAGRRPGQHREDVREA